MRNNSGMGKKEVKSTTFDQEIYFWHNWTVCLRSAMENSTCLFLAIVGGHCGSDTKYRTRSVEMVPLLSCNWDISRHKSFFSIIGIENEAELLLVRASIFAPPWNVQNWIILCPQHYASLSVSWKHSSAKCSISVNLSKHNAMFDKKPKTERGPSTSGSALQIVLKETEIFPPVGTGQSWFFFCDG